MWISGLINPYGVPAQVLRAALDYDVVPVLTQQLLDELAAVLARPKFRRWVTLADASALLAALTNEADVVSEPHVAEQRLRDQDDEYLVALAESATATIVTGDSDLLEAKLGVPVMTPRELIELLGPS